MRIDPGHLRERLGELGGGATDAARGQQTASDGVALQAESAYEPIDRLLLKRLRLGAAAEGARSAISFADAEELARRTAALVGSDPTTAQIAHEGLLRRSLRDLLAD